MRIALVNLGIHVHPGRYEYRPGCQSFAADKATMGSLLNLWTPGLQIYMYIKYPRLSENRTQMRDLSRCITEHMYLHNKLTYMYKASGGFTIASGI